MARQLSDFFANLPISIIGLEATQGAHYGHRVLGTSGHTVRLVAPQFVKPYLQSQKNDRNDAAAICEAISVRTCDLSRPRRLSSRICKRFIEFVAG